MKMKYGNIWKLLLIAVSACLTMTGFVQAESSCNVIVFHAGSLTVPFDAMEKVFEAKYPKVNILREGGGSTEMARMISVSTLVIIAMTIFIRTPKSR